MNEDEFKAQLKTFLVDRCLPIIPLSQLVVDYMLPRRTWDVDPNPPPAIYPRVKSGWDSPEHKEYWRLRKRVQQSEIAVLNETRSSLVVRSVGPQAEAWASWTPLCLEQPLWPGDRVVFDIVPAVHEEPRRNATRIHVGVHGETGDDDVVFQATLEGTSVDHVGKISNVRPHVEDECTNIIPTHVWTSPHRLTELKQIVFARDNTQVVMVIVMGNDTRHVFTLSLATPSVRLVPFMSFYMYRDQNADGWRITASNLVS